MAILQFGDLKQQELHALWDLEEMKRLELRDGTSFEQMIREAQDVAAAVSGEITRLPVYRELFSVQDTPELEYGTFTGGGIQEMTEYSVPDPYRGETTGHMLPIKMYVRTLGWTYLALENRRRNQLEADLDIVVDDIRNDFQVKMLTRFFKMEAEQVNDTVGASVPFADGGVADSKWIPMRSPEGVEFDNTHDHYLRHAAINDANFKAAVEHMTEHGHKPPLVCLASKLDAASFQSLAGWLDPTWEGIVYMAATDRATLKGIEDYHGAVVIPDVGVVFVRFMERIPTGYYSIFKPYGVGSQKNPLRMRIDPLKGFGWSIVPGQYVNSPLNLAVLRAEWGVGIGEDRTNGVFVEVDAAGDYESPTIS